MDFRRLRAIGLDERYDHNWVLDRAGADAGAVVKAAVLRDPASGRTLRMSTSEPGLDMLDGTLRGSRDARPECGWENADICIRGYAPSD
jgi:aldose 1-epimerase